MKKCVFAGTFDPPTVGHKSTIDTCLKMFDEVVVALMINIDKQPYFSLEQRMSLMQKLYQGNKNVKVIVSDKTVVDLLKQENTPYYVRGIRNIIDFTYETDNYFASKKMMNDMVTVYIPCEQENLQISSSLVRNLVHFKKDYDYCIPPEILSDFKRIVEEKDV